MKPTRKMGGEGTKLNQARSCSLLAMILLIGLILTSVGVLAQASHAPTIAIKTSSLTFSVDDAPGTTQFVELDATAAFVGKNVGVKNLGPIWTKDLNEWKHRRAIVTVNPPARISHGFVSIPLVPPSTVRQPVTVPMKIPIRRKDMGNTAGTGSVRLAIYFFENQPAIFDIPITLTAGASQVTPSGTTGTTSGSQAPSSCPVWYADCDGNAGNGCESRIDTPTNCGSCGTKCDPSGPTPACVGGKCSITCPFEFGNCDGTTANGCETNLRTITNCGTCGKTCSSEGNNPGCRFGLCEISCKTGYGNCDGNPDNGCEDSLNSNLNCGACGKSCGSTGVCSIVEGRKVCTASGPGPVAPEINIPGLIGYFPFDSDANDRVTQTVGKTTKFMQADGVFGKAAVFDTTNPIEVGQYAPFRQTDAVSFSFWVNQPVGGQNYVMGSSTKVGSGFGGLLLTPAGSDYHWESQDPIKYPFASSSFNIPENTWTHIAFTIDYTQKQARFFLNGKPQSTSISLPSPNVWTPTNPSPSTSPDRIGGRYQQIPRTFQGALDEFRIYNHVLTETELSTLATAPPGATLTTKPLTIRCDFGLGDCDNNVDNGCETDTTKLPNCGACGNTCSTTGVIHKCDNGYCDCKQGYSKCTGETGVQVCTELKNDKNNCGSCGKRCDGSATCSNGRCCGDGKCEMGENCPQDSSACSSPAHLHKIQSCSNGCQFSSCQPNYFDCDKTNFWCAYTSLVKPLKWRMDWNQYNPSENVDGERPLSSYCTHCGACGIACPHGHSCVNGACIVGGPWPVQVSGSLRLCAPPEAQALSNLQGTPPRKKYSAAGVRFFLDGERLVVYSGNQPCFTAALADNPNTKLSTPDQNTLLCTAGCPTAVCGVNGVTY